MNYVMCSGCDQSSGENDTRKWHVMELVRYAEKYLGIGVGIPSGVRLTLKAWKFKLIATIETHMCSGCRQRVLEKASHMRMICKRVLMVTAVIGLFLVAWSFYSRNFYWCLGLVVCLLPVISLEATEPEKALDAEHDRLLTKRLATFEAEHNRITQRAGSFLARLPNSSKYPVVFPDSDYQVLMENEKQFLGWSLVRKISESSMASDSASDDVTTEQVADAIGEASSAS